MRYTTLQDWLDWQQTLHPKAIDMSLERIALVAERLGLRPARQEGDYPKVITVAGTNGKGSCVKTLESLLLAQGKSVGAFTSPHVLRYNERIRLNGLDASDEQILEAFHAIDQARESISLTYFEFATLAAAWLFKTQQLSYWLLEVGLGGRLDSVNIWDADVAIITSIGIDHIKWLGDNREDIGREKAGILRANRWAVCADKTPPATITAVAEQTGAYLLQAGVDFDWQITQDAELPLVWTCKALGKEPAVKLTLPEPNLPLPSVAGALTALKLLDRLPERDDCQEQLSECHLAGRFQRASFQNRLLVVDVAHNSDAVALLADKVAGLNIAGKIVAVFAAMADKDVDNMIEPLLGKIERWYLPAMAGNARAMQPDHLDKALKAFNQSTVLCENMTQALVHASQIDDDGLILVFGSFYTVEACLRCEGVKVSSSA